MLIFLGAMAGFCLTGDLFNMFVFFELMSVAAYALTAYKVEEDGADGRVQLRCHQQRRRLSHIGGNRPALWPHRRFESGPARTVAGRPAGRWLSDYGANAYYLRFRH